jgi:hypothetical protein
MDFSGAPEAADYVAEFLHTAMLKDVTFGTEETDATTDLEAVRRALDRLRTQNKLTDADYERVLDLLEEKPPS